MINILLVLFSALIACNSTVFLPSAVKYVFTAHEPELNDIVIRIIGDEETMRDKIVELVVEWPDYNALNDEHKDLVISTLHDQLLAFIHKATKVNLEGKRVINNHSKEINEFLNEINPLLSTSQLCDEITLLIRQWPDYSRTLSLEDQSNLDIYLVVVTLRISAEKVNKLTEWGKWNRSLNIYGSRNLHPVKNRRSTIRTDAGWEWK